MFTRNGCIILPGMYQRRTAVWEGRGATARPWEAKWSSGVAPVLGRLYCSKNVFKILDLSILLSICRAYIYTSTYIYTCSAGYAGLLPVVLLYRLQC